MLFTCTRERIGFRHVLGMTFVAYPGRRSLEVHIGALSFGRHGRGSMVPWQAGKWWCYWRP